MRSIKLHKLLYLVGIIPSSNLIDQEINLRVSIKPSLIWYFQYTHKKSAKDIGKTMQ